MRGPGESPHPGMEPGICFLLLLVLFCTLRRTPRPQQCPGATLAHLPLLVVLVCI
jgi:hypothetical protein